MKTCTDISDCFLAFTFPVYLRLNQFGAASRQLTKYRWLEYTPTMALPTKKHISEQELYAFLIKALGPNAYLHVDRLNQNPSLSPVQTPELEKLKRAGLGVDYQKIEDSFINELQLLLSPINLNVEIKSSSKHPQKEVYVRGNGFWLSPEIRIMPHMFDSKKLMVSLCHTESSNRPIAAYTQSYELWDAVKNVLSTKFEIC